MNPRQTVRLGEVLHECPNRIRIDAAAVSLFSIEHGIFLMVPLAAVAFRLFEVVGTILTETIQNTVIKRQPAITGTTMRMFCDLRKRQRAHGCVVKAYMDG